MKKWIIIVIGIVVVVVLVGGGFMLRQSGGTTEDLRTVTLEPRTVKQDITFSGRLSPITASDISFELPGTVTEFFVEEGVTVAAGESLAILDTSSVSLELAQARATTVSTQGTAKLAWEQAQQARQRAAVVNTETLAKRRQAVVDAKRELDQAKAVHAQRARESGDDSVLTETAVAALRSAESAWHTAQKTLNETLATADQSNTSAAATEASAYSEYLATVQTARGVAGLSSLQAQERLVANKSNKHTLFAPFAGTITVRHKEVGEAALAGQPVITVAQVDHLELAATATETDAIKLTMGLPATITFDALPSTEQWTGTVSYISPAAEITDGIPLYKVKLTLTEPIGSLRPGLTANITVHAATRENVLAIPRRAITIRGEEEFVSVLTNDEEIIEKKVTTGLLGSDGSVEIRTGLEKGERVVINPGDITRDDDTTTD